MPYFTNRGITPLPVGGGAYLLDQITPQPTAAFATRRIKSGITNAFQMCDASQANVTDLGFDGTEDLDTAALNTYYSGHSNYCFAKKAYDQSGNTRHFTGVAGEMAVLRSTDTEAGTAQLINSHPAVRFEADGAQSSISSGTLHLSDLVTSSAYTIISSVLVKSAGFAATRSSMLSDGDDGYLFANSMSIISAANSASTSNYDTGYQTVSSTVSADTAYVLVTRLTGGSLQLYVNGTAATPVSAGNLGAMTYAIVRLGKGGIGSKMLWLDHLIYNTALSNADINTLCSASGVINGNVAARAGVTWTSI